ncbi:MAG: O-antigen ligase family protein [Gaiellaceae bacterium MAG52_C11]|nr:O-antigen ligase family protein [Candidatus Gaiellasilicea maunaloa]
MAERFPRYALYAFIVGLPFHNVVMAELYELGLRGLPLDVLSAWKEVLLAGALGAVVWSSRGIPFRFSPTDWLALAFATFVVLYALIPQDWLGGEASGRGILYGLRHGLTPVAAYVLGRSLHLGRDELRRVGTLILGAAVVVATWGLIDVYAIPLDAWRNSGAPGWYAEQLGLDYGPAVSGLPENFVYNPGDERPLRRLVSTFLSPLASGYLLLVALLVAAAWQRSRWLSVVSGLLLVGLLFTYSRTALAALALGLVVLAYALRNWWPLAAATVLVATGFFFVKAYPDFGPETTFTPAELEFQRGNAQGDAETSGDPTSFDEPSVDSHLDSLREGIDTVIRHPQGFGLGNAGVTAKRTGEEIKAGESTYTELGVELGLLGMLAFVAWNLALLRRILPRAPWLGAAVTAVLALGIQTDVIGVHWLAFVLWTLAGERA